MRDKNKYFIAGAIVATVAALAGAILVILKERREFVESISEFDGCLFENSEGCNFCDDANKCEEKAE